MGLIQRLKNVVSGGGQQPDEREIYRCSLCEKEFDTARQTCPDCGSNVQRETVTA